jgi:RNA polymerase sigma-70 factor, ECF subfamily
MDGGSDSELALRSKAGDVAAYAELVRRHRRGAYRVALCILSCREDAEDAVQEALVSAYRGIRRLDHTRAFAPWLKRIVVNCAVSRLRRRSRERRAEPATWEREVEPVSEHDPTDDLAATQLSERVRRAVQCLPLKQRLAVALFHLDGMDLAETAQVLGCSVSAVKAHLCRGRKSLATRLAVYLEEG